MKKEITAEYLRKNGNKLEDRALAFGEVTGHSHSLETMEGVERYELDGKEYLIVSAVGGVALDHEEHGVGIVTADIYEKRIDREYDYSANAIRNVAD